MQTVAELARSILGSPTGVEVAMDGVPYPMGDAIALRDWGGAPVFVCRPDGALANAGRYRRHVLVSVTGECCADDEALVMVGHLRHAGSDGCECCTDERQDFVVVDLTHVFLTRRTSRIAIDLGDFADPALQLNPGFLRRSEAHINQAHSAHLRAAVARATGSDQDAIIASQIVDLGPGGVEVQWVTDEGAHRRRVDFERPARSVDELSECFRAALSLDVC